MYITDLHVQNLKLLRDFKLSFGTAESPRMWTVLIGENGLCKTAILRAIAMAAVDPTQGKIRRLSHLFQIAGPPITQ